MKHHLLTLLLAFAACLSAAAQDNTDYYFGILYQILDDDARTCKVIYADSYETFATTKPQISVAPSVDINGKTYTVTTIDQWAFFGTAFTHISLPATITSISEDAFDECEYIEEFNVADGNTTFCSIDGVLFTKDRKTLLFYPLARPGESYTVPAGTTAIGSNVVFDAFRVKSITLPEGLTSIGDNSLRFFEYLTDITLPSTLTHLGTSVLTGCTNMTAINVAPNNPAFTSCDGVLFSKDMTTLCLYPVGRPANTYTIPTTVTTIGDYAFYAAKKLSHLYLPEGLTTIGHAAIYGCEGLTDLAIPANVTSISEYAFAFSSKLANIYCRGTVPAQVGSNAFNQLPSNYTVHIPMGTKSAYTAAGWEDSNLREKAEVTPPCAKPIIEFVNGQLRITSATPGAYCTVRAYMPSFSGSSSKELGLDNATSFTAKPTLKVQAWARRADNSYSMSDIAERTFQLGTPDIDGNDVLDINDINTLLDSVLLK